MFDLFSSAALKTILLAQEEARRMRHELVGPEHLLLGLIGVGSGVAFALLQSCGLNLSRARKVTAQMLGRIDTSRWAPILSLKFTSEAQSVFDLATELAARLGKDHIGTGELLLALLERSNHVHVLFVEVGIDAQLLRAATEEKTKTQEE